jgi:uncharacterized membrane protein
VNYNLSEWVNLIVRWFHVFAGILWVGQTFLFTWMDRTLNKEESLWLVHSGGFYMVERQKVPKDLPQTLHWFRWEAAMTWLSGMALLIVVYYLGGLLDTQTFGGPTISIVVGFIMLAAAWVIYDALWWSPQSLLTRREPVGAMISFALLFGIIFGLTHVMNGRAAYIHVGAMLGTFMTANVWLRILPFQRQMVDAVKKRILPDMSLGDRAKQRTKHNTYMVVPVVFIMISNHFPVATYGNQYNWLVLSVLIIVGCLAAKALRTR